MKIILIGIQGSGKSTQGNLLSEKINIPYLSTGHILRKISREKTQEGRYIKEVLNSGTLLPDSKMLPIVEEYLNRDEYKKGYILDGFPRTVNQAKTFKQSIDNVIYLDVSDREALWRLSFREDDDGREDETLAAVRKRIELFHKHTKPVLDFYREQKILIEVDGEQSIEAIHQEIVEKLKT